MRWLLALSLAACSTTVEYDTMTDRTEPALLAALRDAEGHATIIAGDRCYTDRDGVLHPAVAALAKATADAVTSGAIGYPGLPRTYEPGTVHAFTANDRLLTVGAVMITSIRLDDGSRLYCVQAAVARDRYVWTSVPGTPAIDGAWDRLVAEARGAAKGTIPIHWIGTRAHDFVRDIGVDVRGTGGAKP
jgi:hypothetical protein